MEEKAKLLILWTTGEKETAMNMALLYAYNALFKGWWDDVTLLIWGASAQLAVEDDDVKEYLARIRDVGVRVIACKRCALNMGVADDLEAQGVEVFFTGEFITDWLLSGDKLLSV